MQITTQFTTTGPTIVLRGDLDARCTWQVREALHEEIERADEVVVDMSDVEIVDLTALRMLGATSVQAARAGHHVTLRGCSPAVRRLLHMSRLIRVVEVERSAATA